MYEAHRAGAFVVTITPMSANWVVRAFNEDKPFEGITVSSDYHYFDGELDSIDDIPEVIKAKHRTVFGVKFDYNNELGDFADFTLNPAFYYSKYYTINDLGTGGFGTYDWSIQGGGVNDGWLSIGASTASARARRAR